MVTRASTLTDQTSILNEATKHFFTCLMQDSGAELHKKTVELTFDHSAHKVFDGMSRTEKWKQNGTVQEYYDRFMTWVQKTGMKESHVIDFFVSGLHPDIKKTIKMFEPKSLSDAYRLAHLQERTNEILKKQNVMKNMTNPSLLCSSNTKVHEGVASFSAKQKLASGAGPGASSVQKNDDPLSLIKLNSRTDWDDDERGTRHEFVGKSIRDQEKLNSETSGNINLNSSFIDKRDLFQENLVGLVKRKKEVSKKTDFYDPVRKSFEVELERVQKMQEIERKLKCSKRQVTVDESYKPFEEYSGIALFEEADVMGNGPDEVFDEILQAGEQNSGVEENSSGLEILVNLRKEIGNGDQYGKTLLGYMESQVTSDVPKFCESQIVEQECKVAVYGLESIDSLVDYQECQVSVGEIDSSGNHSGEKYHKAQASVSAQISILEPMATSNNDPKTLLGMGAIKRYISSLKIIETIVVEKNEDKGRSIIEEQSKNKMVMNESGAGVNTIVDFQPVIHLHIDQSNAQILENDTVSPSVAFLSNPESCGPSRLFLLGKFDVAGAKYFLLPSSFGEGCWNLTLQFEDLSSNVVGKSFKLTILKISEIQNFIVERRRYDNGKWEAVSCNRRKIHVKFDIWKWPNRKKNGHVKTNLVYTSVYVLVKILIKGLVNQNLLIVLKLFQGAPKVTWNQYTGFCRDILMLIFTVLLV